MDILTKIYTKYDPDTRNGIIENIISFVHQKLDILFNDIQRKSIETINCDGLYINNYELGKYRINIIYHHQELDHVIFRLINGPIINSGILHPDRSTIRTLYICDIKKELWTPNISLQKFKNMIYKYISKNYNSVDDFFEKNNINYETNISSDYKKISDLEIYTYDYNKK